jgi:short-subunit dehydrogenase
MARLIEGESELAVLVNDAGFSGYGRFAEVCLPEIEDLQVVEALDAAERAMIAHTRVTTLASSRQ